MALVAIHAVVHIAAHSPVIGVGLRFGVTVGTGKDRIVVRVGVAGGANTARIAMVQVEPGVIERTIGPLDGVVTRGAGSRESRRDVIRVCRVLIVRPVAPVAVRGQRRVVVVDVAIDAGARRHQVRTGQREPRLAVIKRGVGPFHSVVTDLARLRKPCLGVVRAVGVVVVGQVAGDARRIFQRVIVVDVAVLALARRHHVGSGQRPTGLRVVELAIGPCRCVVAGFAG